MNIDITLFRREDKEVLYKRHFTYYPENIDVVKDMLGKETSSLIRIMEKDARGPLTFGHFKVAAAVGKCLDSNHIVPGTTVLVNSECDLNTNYVMTIQYSETPLPKLSLLERASKCLWSFIK